MRAVSPLANSLKTLMFVSYCDFEYKLLHELRHKFHVSSNRISKKKTSALDRSANGIN